MKELCLGTATWGWSVDENVAFSILDHFYSKGNRHVDTANNYPINGNINDYHKSPLFISKWCKSRNVKDLKITYKVGSLINSNTPENNLSPQYLQTQIDQAREMFRSNLNCIMIHWDNRDNPVLIAETLDFLGSYLRKFSLELGLSGIANPLIYQKVLADLKFSNINIQIKHNFLHSNLEKYDCLSEFSPKFWGYGISVSGLKLSPEEYNEKSYVSLARGINYHQEMVSPKLENTLRNIVNENDIIKNLYHIAIVFSEQEKRLFGYIIAPSKLEQIQDITNFLDNVDVRKINLGFSK